MTNKTKIIVYLVSPVAATAAVPRFSYQQLSHVPLVSVDSLPTAN